MKPHAHRRLSAALAAGLAMSVAATLAAPPQRLDDSASPRPQIQPLRALSEQGRPLEDSPHARQAVLQFGRIDYRLSTAPWIGQPVRIYYVLPPLVTGLRSPAGLRVDWRGLGAFASGSGRPGGRYLVWSGTVPGPWMNEAIDLSWVVDLQQVELRPGEPFSMQAYFEIEVMR